MSDEKNCSEGVSYKLRAGAPQMVLPDGCTNMGSRSGAFFVIQTFGVEKRVTNNVKAATQLLESNDFVGLNAEGDYESANYQSTQYTNAAGDIVFAGQEVKNPEYISEEELPGFSEVITT